MRSVLLRSTKPAASCVTCFAWGVLPGKNCGACLSFNQTHPLGECATCGRTVPVRKGYCRLCWHEASRQARGIWTPTLQPILEKISSWQLFLADLQRPRTQGVRVAKSGRRALRRVEPAADPVAPHSGWIQLPLFDEIPRDFNGFDRRRDADLANPFLLEARRHAQIVAESRGWTRWVISDVDRALVVVLSGHNAGDKVCFSEMFPALRARGLSVERTAEILAALDLLADDRVPTFESWLDRKLTGLTPGIRADVEDWLRTLHDGGPRSQPRSQETVWAYLSEILPILRTWSARFDHLREITRDDVLAAVDPLHGSKRHHTSSVLRSLFRHCKRTGTIFRDPAARIRVGRQDYGVVVPLAAEELDRAVTAAATSSAARLTLVVAAIHAARPTAIRDLALDDVDLGNRRLTIGGRTRPLDDMTLHVINEWLEYRRSRWPNTANPHLILSQQTALETGPVSKVWLTEPFRRHSVSLERLRVDRQLEEALTVGPDPLHLAEVFGLDDKTAIRYAHAARALLESRAEQHTTGKQGSSHQPPE
jgi:site-specific recombinase XerD